MSAVLLAEINRTKVLFQMRAIAAVIGARPHPGPHSGTDHAGGPSNGHPARKSEHAGPAAHRGATGMKGGNGDHLNRGNAA